jgi:hypothetical protein
MQVWGDVYGSYTELCAAERVALGMKAAWFFAHAGAVRGETVNVEDTLLRLEPVSSNGFILTEEYRGIVTTHTYDAGKLLVAVRSKHAEPKSLLIERTAADGFVLEQLQSLRYAVMLLENGVDTGLHYDEPGTS